MARLFLFFLCVSPLSLAAHPHIFIEAGFDIQTDGAGRLTHVRVTWIYDEYYSLLITEDLRLDQDFDGELTDAETERLTGFDMRWVDGFNGDLVATLDGEPLALSGPTEATAELRDGRIITTHLRSVTGTPSLTGHVLSLKPYDETYYTAYEVTQPVTMTGKSVCMLEQIPPNIDEQLARMQQMLLSIDANADLEENDIPMMGAEFATEIRVSCGAS
ncbi:DUF1007 family protein [Rhodobacteraceae bacterium F11138]|nr:DUF1007 family protein [Rhodobacteraceae bacterium F11138]